MSDLRYYLDDYSDEAVPCDCTLEGWADWLSRPSTEWDRESAAEDGERFTASVLRFAPDVVATHGPDGWTLSHTPVDPALIAVRFGAGAGWDADNIVGDIEGLIDWLDELRADGSVDEVEYVAIAHAAPDVVLTYRADPPRLELGTVQ